MMRVYSKTIVLFFSLIIGLQSLPRACAFEATDPSADKHGALTVDGYFRSYTIHIPPNVGRRPPVVFMLHGRGGTKEQAAAEFGWRELADRERFIAVFPQALPIIPDLALDSLTPASVPSWLGSTKFTIWWSSGFARNLPALHHPDDEVFLTRLIAKIVDDEHVDPCRVYIAGFSSGGGMVADLAARYPEIARAFAAIASIGGLRPSKLTAPVSLLLLQGDADSTGWQPDYWAQIPLEQKLSWFGQASLPTLSSEAESWAVLDHCVSSAKQSIPWGQRFVWNGCASQAHLEVYRIHGLGHEWPGSSVSRWNQSHPSLPPLDLTAIIWEFCKLAP